MKLDILGGSYPGRYIESSSQRTINWMPIPFGQNDKAVNDMALQSRPGLTMYYNIPGRYSRGGIYARSTNATIQFNRTFVVVDKTLWEVNSNQTVTNRGVMTNISYGSTPCKFAVNGNTEVAIFSYAASYVFNMSTNTLTQITDVNFPNNVVSCSYCDGYMFVVSANGYVYFSEPDNALNWTGALPPQAFHPTFKSAASLACVAYRDKMFIFSGETIEPYFEDGNTDIWSRYPGSIMYTGLYNSNAVSVYDNGIIFVGTSAEGGKHVYLLANEYSFTLQPLSESDPCIQWALNSTPGALEGCWSHIQKARDGQSIYRLFCPALKTTYCLNLATQMWYEEKSFAPALDCDGTYHSDMFRGIHCIPSGDNVLFQDLYSGAIFYEDYTNMTDNNTFIRRERTSNTFSNEFKNISTTHFELDASKGPGTTSGQGSKPVIMFQISGNGGHSYNDPKNIPLGLQGNYNYRARVEKLGTNRQWTLKLSLTDPVDLMIQNAYADGQVDQN